MNALLFPAFFILEGDIFFSFDFSVKIREKYFKEVLSYNGFFNCGSCGGADATG